MKEKKAVAKLRHLGFLTLIGLVVFFTWRVVSVLAGEPVQVDWVKTYDGPGQTTDIARALAVDPQGCVYVTGVSMRTSYAYSFDFATIKYSPTGGREWVSRYGPYGGRYMDQAHAISVDGMGNVYVAGMSKGSSNYDFTLIKYDASGNFLWDRRYGAAMDDYAAALALEVDSFGNAYVTGYVGGSGVIMKFDSAGTALWPYKEIPGIRPGFLGLDASGNVYVAGTAAGGSGTDFFILKYDQGGNQLWDVRYDTPEHQDDRARGMVVDPQGNVYVTGDSVVNTFYPFQYVYTTVKYDSGGGFQWMARYSGVDRENIPLAIGVDTEGNVFVTGWSSYSNDYGHDFATVKYDASGNKKWANRFRTGIYNEARALAVDRKGSVYVTGGSWNAGSADGAYTIKYSPTGERLWLSYCPGASSTSGNAIKVDFQGNVYVAGEVWVQSPSGFVYPDYVTFKLKQPEFGSGYMPMDLLLLD